GRSFSVSGALALGAERAGRAIGVDGGGTDGQGLGPADRAVTVAIEAREQAREMRLQFGQGDAVVIVLVDIERAGQRVAVTQPALGPVGELKIAERALMRRIDRLEAALDAGLHLLAAG